MNVGVSVTCKIRANEGTLPVHSDYSNTTDSLTVPIVDADGNTYTAITIGTQRWLVENLQTTKYNDGSSINNPIDANWAADTVGAFGWINGDIANKPVWGALYNRPATLNAKGIAPVGTRIPNNADWDTLIAYLGTATAAGGHLKITGTTYWAQAHADNSSGFTGVGSGYRNETTGNSVANKKYYGMFGTTEGKIYYLNPYDVTTASADWTQYPKRGISIRCIIN
jgi:uncharacterized protein (TIGR02145 family)